MGCGVSIVPKKRPESVAWIQTNVVVKSSDLKNVCESYLDVVAEYFHVATIKGAGTVRIPKLSSDLVRSVVSLRTCYKETIGLMVFKGHRDMTSLLRFVLMLMDFVVTYCGWTRLTTHDHRLGHTLLDVKMHVPLYKKLLKRMNLSWMPRRRWEYTLEFTWRSFSILSRFSPAHTKTKSWRHICNVLYNNYDIMRGGSRHSDPLPRSEIKRILLQAPKKDRRWTDKQIVRHIQTTPIHEIET